MNVAFGLKAHSGWAALVAVGEHHGDIALTDRRRIELVKESWQKQPYHAAEKLKPAYALSRLAINLGMSIGPAAAGFIAAKSYFWIFIVDSTLS